MTRGEIEGVGEEESRGRRIGRRVEGLISFVGDQGWISGEIVGRKMERGRGERTIQSLTQTQPTHSSSTAVYYLRSTP